ncbi:tail protein X [Halomonas sp. CUBES01]|uniref:tail protein X n=1 Tax=Halomonadaceae TaxID=28256 RepID=UPI001E58CAAE|nr:MULTISPECIES: tail protein X [Halomonas]MCZ0930287.1 tail protein X [Halomonas janggokensis]MEC4767928.1 tail protein X [Halomonas sp. CUBES01]
MNRNEPNTLRARQNETLDALCYRAYGVTQNITEQVLAANPGLAELGPQLPQGTAVTLPAIPASPSRAPRVQLWD